jgi:hypothetical protein
MSNLGDYIRLTSFAKKVGGPKAMMAIAAGSGYVIVRAVEAVGKKVVTASKDVIKRRSVPCGAAGKLFTVVSDGEDIGGLKLRVDDAYRVLACDGDSILIEVLKDANNPYFVSRDFLESVSDFEIEDNSDGT